MACAYHGPLANCGPECFGYLYPGVPKHEPAETEKPSKPEKKPSKTEAYHDPSKISGAV